MGHRVDLPWVIHDPQRLSSTLANCARNNAISCMMAQGPWFKTVDEIKHWTKPSSPQLRAPDVVGAGANLEIGSGASKAIVQFKLCNAVFGCVLTVVCMLVNSKPNVRVMRPLLNKHTAARILSTAQLATAIYGAKFNEAVSDSSHMLPVPLLAILSFHFSSQLHHNRNSGPDSAALSGWGRRVRARGSRARPALSGASRGTRGSPPIQWRGPA